MKYKRNERNYAFDVPTLLTIGGSGHTLLRSAIRLPRLSHHEGVDTMMRRLRIVLLVPAVLLLAVVVGHRPAKAAQTGTSRGVTLIQLGCGQSPNGPVSGPSTIGVSTGGCDNNDAAGGFRLPSGTLYNLRAQFGAFTTDTMPPSLKVMIYTGASRVPVLVCEGTINKSKCEALTHQA